MHREYSRRGWSARVQQPVGSAASLSVVVASLYIVKIGSSQSTVAVAVTVEGRGGKGGCFV
jgi:hypothetical protein